MPAKLTTSLIFSSPGAANILGVIFLMLLLLLNMPFSRASSWVADGDGLNRANTCNAFVPRLAVSHQGSPYVTWSENNNSNGLIYVSHWDGYTWVQNGQNINNFHYNTAIVSSIALAPDDTPYLSWFGNAAHTAPFPMYISKQKNGVWIQQGNSIATDNMFSCLAIAPNAAPFVAFERGGGPPRAAFGLWNGSDWSTYSLRHNTVYPTSNWVAAAPSLVISPNNIPYIAWYENYTLSGTGAYSTYQIYVSHWNGSSIENDGGSLNRDAAKDASRPSMAIAPNGSRYVAWHENTSVTSQIFVDQWNGVNWAKVGEGLNRDLTKAACNPSLAIAPDNTPYVAWSEDNGSAYQIYVSHWNGYAWVPDGGSMNRDSSKVADYPSLAIAPNGTLYVAWREYNAGNNINLIHVSHYGPPMVPITSTATPTVSPTLTSTPTLSATAATPSAAVPYRFFKIVPSRINPNHGEQALVKWTQPQSGPVSITIYNLLGDKIRSLAEHQEYSAGVQHEVRWDGRNQDNTPCSTGIYIVLLKGAGYQEVGKAAVIK